MLFIITPKSLVPFSSYCIKIYLFRIHLSWLDKAQICQSLKFPVIDTIVLVSKFIVGLLEWSKVISKLLTQLQNRKFFFRLHECSNVNSNKWWNPIEEVYACPPTVAKFWFCLNICLGNEQDLEFGRLGFPREWFHSKDQTNFT